MGADLEEDVDWGFCAAQEALDGAVEKDWGLEVLPPVLCVQPPWVLDGVCLNAGEHGDHGGFRLILDMWFDE
jgi:hypothetical protein